MFPEPDRPNAVPDTGQSVEQLVVNEAYVRSTLSFPLNSDWPLLHLQTAPSSCWPALPKPVASVAERKAYSTQIAPDWDFPLRYHIKPLRLETEPNCLALFTKPMSPSPYKEYNCRNQT